MNEKQQRAAIYVRVSSDDQVREGYGLVYQERQAREFATKQNYSLEKKHIYVDDGFSGILPVEERPKLKALLEAATRKEFDIVLVFRLDRLSRKMRLLLEVVDELSKYQIGIQSITEPFETKTPTGRFFLQQLGSMAELEREIIRDRIVSGRREAARKGIWVFGAGGVPYGYKFNPKTKKLIVNHKEERWVRKIFEWVIFERLSLYKISTRLMDAGVPAPGFRAQAGKVKRAYWPTRTVGRIITNEVYMGVAYLGKRKVSRGKFHILAEGELTPKKEWIPIQIPALISSETFQSAQKQLKRNLALATPTRKYPYLYGQLVYCGYCGRKFSGAYLPPQGKQVAGMTYYRPPRPYRYRPTLRGCERCANVAEYELSHVWNTISDLLKNPDRTIPHLLDYMERKTNVKKMREAIAERENALERIEHKKKKLLRLHLDEDVLDFETYKTEKKACDDQEQRIRSELTRLRQLQSRGDGISPNRLRELYKKLKIRLDSATYEEKRYILRLLVERVDVLRHEREAQVELHFPLGGITMEGFLKQRTPKTSDEAEDAGYEPTANCPGLTQQ